LVVDPHVPFRHQLQLQVLDRPLDRRRRRPILYLLHHPAYVGLLLGTELSLALDFLRQKHYFVPSQCSCSYGLVVQLVQKTIVSTKRMVEPVATWLSIFKLIQQRMDDTRSQLEVEKKNLL
jgi:hypothetical protein